MNKSMMILKLASISGHPRKVVEEVIDAQALLARATLKEGGDLTLTGICTLRVKRREARQGRNPKTGDPLQIPAKTVVSFVAAKSLSDVLPQPN